MRTRLRFVAPFVAPFVAVAALAAASSLGPPSIAVRAVTGTPPTPNAVLEITTEHHHEDYTVTGRALTMRDGREEERPIALSRVGSTERYGVAPQWERGTAWVLIFTVRQGSDDDHGTAEAMVRVDAQGRLGEITTAGRTNRTTDRWPRAFKQSEIRAALGG